jgi:hypothetical protein
MPNLINDKYLKQFDYLAIFFFALILRIVAFIFWSPEFWEYETIAVNFLTGRGFVFTHIGNVDYKAYCEPLYPFVCILIYYFTQHSVFAMILVQVIVSSLIAIVVYFLGKDIYSPRIGVLAGILTAVHPGLLVYTIKFHPLIFDAFFISLTTLTMVKLLNNFTLKNVVIAGIISGLCILTRPTILFFLLFGWGYILLVNKIRFKKAAGYSLILFCLFSVVTLPWVLRNYSVFNKFVLTRTNGPYVFWLGNNPNFSGSAIDKNGRSLLELAPKEFREKINSLDEVGQNSEFLSSALAYIKKYPLDFFERITKKFYYFWWFTPQAGLLYPALLFSIFKVFSLLLLFFGVCGIIFSFIGKAIKQREKTNLALILLLSISFVQSLFYVETRHRLSIEPVFLVFVAQGIFICLKKILGGKNENNR